MTTAPDSDRATAAEFFKTTGMAAIFAPEAHVRQMLAFEAALANAEARAGIIPAHAAEAIVKSCRMELFDVPALYREAMTAGTLAIPLVRALSERVGEEGRAHVHRGATSQDVLDTALMLEMRAGLDLLIAELLRVGAECAGLAAEHRLTLIAGRTVLQQAVPITFGLKAARWLSLTTRQIQELETRRHSTLALQFGGAAGTLAALGQDGIRVARFLAEELQLPLPDMPWHAERDRVATIAAVLGVAAGSMSKIATDIVLLAQSEVGEVAESAAPGKGVSSAMPQKRNPVDAVAALAAARLALGQVSVVLGAMAQEHERAAGGWQAEWTAVPDLFAYCAGSVAHVRSSLTGIDVDRERMHTNLGSRGGALMAESLTMALSPSLGRPEAECIVRAAIAQSQLENVSLSRCAHESARIRDVLSPAAIDGALDPAGYLGSAGAFIDRALESYHELERERAAR